MTLQSAPLVAGVGGAASFRGAVEFIFRACGWPGQNPN